MRYIAAFIALSNIGLGQWCHIHLEEAEKKFKIPKHTLKAIALTESGQYVKGKGMIPWPWTINVNGKGYFFPTKEKAVQTAKTLDSMGQKNFDMGCMQINNYHHGQEFHSFEQAFDPKENVNYGARFLKKLYDQNNSWGMAIGHYHSKTPELSKSYLKLISKHLKKIVDEEGYMFYPTLEQTAFVKTTLSDKLNNQINLKKEKQDYSYQESYEGRHKLIRLVNHLNNLHRSKETYEKVQQKQVGFAHLNTMKITRFIPGNQSKIIKNGPVKIVRYHAQSRND